MNNDKSRTLLVESIENLEQLQKWLVHSNQICTAIGTKDDYSIEELDALEAMTSRFGRCFDYLVNCVFRLIDQLELIDNPTIIDTINRAEKRGIVESAKRLREMKELRNEINYEYARTELIEVFSNVFQATPELLQVVDKTILYTQKFN